MAKAGGGAGGPGGLPFNLGDMGGILKQAQDMQRKMAKITEELKERVVEASSGGGMVTAQASGAKELVGIKISKECVDPNDLGMLEDLVVAAVNQALKKANELHEKDMAKVTGGLGGGMGLPGMF